MELNRVVGATDITSDFDIADDGFRCSYKHCPFSGNVLGIDYWKYDDINNYSYCKEMCRNKSNCEAVECGTDHCALWNIGACGKGDTQRKYGYFARTCLKYDDGNFYYYENTGRNKLTLILET